MVETDGPPVLLTEEEDDEEEFEKVAQDDGPPVTGKRDYILNAERDYQGSFKNVPEAVETEEMLNVPDPEDLIFGKRAPFSELGIEDGRLLQALPKLGFRNSTRVQAAAIPPILEKDRRAVVINAETGSGKTLAYLLPAIELCLRSRRKKDAANPTILIVVPGRELGYQIEMVARRILKAIRSKKQLSVFACRRAWPETMPDILITTPRAAAQGLEPCSSEDEISRVQALARIKGTEMVVLDEADALLGGGGDTRDIHSLMVAAAAALPDAPRRVLPEAQVYYEHGVPVEVLDTDTVEWKPARARGNNDGTFNICHGPGNWEFRVRRCRLRGPGIALHVENGPRWVLACATLPHYTRNRLMEDNAQDNVLYTNGVGSADWVIKRWFPQAVRIQSQWIHKRHPCLVKQDWIYIAGERRAKTVRNLPLRLKKLADLLLAQDPTVRTLVFATSPDTCIAAELALKSVKLPVAGLHSAVSLEDRLNALKKFATGEVTVLVCTDLAARGLDLPVCRHVVMLEFARSAVEFLHRVGRAARAGRHSKATYFWGDGDSALREIVKVAPEMGLSGVLPEKEGNRWRLKRTRRKQRKQVMTYNEVRKMAREARQQTQRKPTERVIKRSS